MTYKDENAFVKNIDDSSPTAREIWAHLRADNENWPDKTDMSYPQLIQTVYSNRLNHITSGKNASGTFEEGKALNRSYARASMLAELASNLLAYPSEYAQAHGVRALTEPGGAEVIAPPFGGKVHIPGGIETQEFWRYRVENMHTMGAGGLHYALMNKLRPEMVNMFNAVRDNLKGLEESALDSGMLQLESYGRFKAAKRDMMPQIATIRQTLLELEDELDASDEIAEERGESIDAATKRFRMITKFVREEIVQELHYELDVMRELIPALEKRTSLPAKGLITDQTEAEIVPLPHAVTKPVKQPKEAARAAAITRTKQENPEGMITEEELNFARALRDEKSHSVG